MTERMKNEPLDEERFQESTHQLRAQPGFYLTSQRDTSRISTTYSFYEFYEELRDEEERDMLILKLRENIIGSLIDELYNRFLDRQVIPFTVQCFEESLRKLMNWYFFSRDLGDGPSDWEEDEPPPPVPVDNWASYCIPAGVELPRNKVTFKTPFERHNDENVGNNENEKNFVEQELPDFEDDRENEMSYEKGHSLTLTPDRSHTSPSETVEQPLNNDDNEKNSTPGLQTGLKVTKKAHFSDQPSPASSRAIKVKREIYQWISPKNFPPIRVNPTLTHIPGEMFSSKTCGRRVPTRNIVVRPAKPTFINARGQEVRSFSF